MKELKGLFTALVTPFNENGIDIQGLKENIESQIENGVDGIFVLGTTGESPTLTKKERNEVIHTAVETAQKRVPVLVGTGTNCTKTTYERTEDAKNLGADCAVIVLPYYNRPTQEGIYRHIHAVHSNVEFPLCLYNVPKRTGITLEFETILRLAALPRVIGLKDCTGDLKQLKDIIKALSEIDTSFSILSGDDYLCSAMIQQGARGLMSVASNLIPKTISQLVHSCLNGDTSTRDQLQLRLLPLFNALSLESNPIPIKTAMNLWGLPAGPCRLPLCEMNKKNLNALAHQLKEYENLKPFKDLEKQKIKSLA